MRILVVTHYFWPETFRINDLVQAWGDRGHDVTVLTGLPNYGAGKLFPGFTWRGPYRQSHGRAVIRRVPMLTRGPNRATRLALNYLTTAASAMIFGPFIARGRVDAIFVYAPSPFTTALPGVWLGWLRRVPVTLWVQDLWPDNLVAAGAVRSPRVLRAVAALCRWVYRRCDLVLGQSDAFVDAIRRVCPDVRDLRVLPNWADPFYRPRTLEVDAPERRELPEGFTIVFAGNLGSAQALDTVLDAAALTREAGVQWVFIGDGNQRAPLEAACRERGLETCVRFLGWRPAEAMPRYLSLAGALLVSLKRDPGFASTIPAKLQSSLAMGRPVLAALEGEGARVVTDSGAGIVVEPENAQALANGALALLAAGDAARDALGQRGRAYAERHFDRDRLIHQLDGWLNELRQRGRR